MVKPDKGGEDLGNVVRAATQSIFADPAAASLKRVAWAFSLNPDDSEYAGPLLDLLRSKLAEVP